MEKAARAAFFCFFDAAAANFGSAHVRGDAAKSVHTFGMDGYFNPTLDSKTRKQNRAST